MKTLISVKSGPSFSPSSQLPTDNDGVLADVDIGANLRRTDHSVLLDDDTLADIHGNVRTRRAAWRARSRERTESLVCEEANRHITIKWLKAS